MPDGKTHTFATLLVAGAAGYGSYHYHYLAMPQALALAGGVLAGLILSPDLDVDGFTMSNYYASGLGRLPAMTWWLLWRPYAWVVPHRSPLSHWPLLGTVLRLGYLWGVIYLVALGLHQVAPVAIPQIHFIPWWGLYAFSGLTLADFGHWVLDNTIKGQKRSWR